MFLPFGVFSPIRSSFKVATGVLFKPKNFGKMHAQGSGYGPLPGVFWNTIGVETPFPRRK